MRVIKDLVNMFIKISKVADMQVELEELQPKLVVASEENINMMKVCILSKICFFVSFNAVVKYAKRICEEPRGLVVRRCAHGSRGPEFESRLNQNKDHR